MNIRKATIAILLAMVLCLGAAPEALAAAGDADTAADAQQTVEQKDNDSTNDNTASAAESSAQEASEEAAKTSEAADGQAGTSEDTTKQAVRYKTVTKLVKRSIRVRGKANGKVRIRITWARISGSDGYQVYRAGSKNGKYRLVYATRSSSSTRWVDKSRKLKMNKTYYYKVVPRDKSSLYKKKKVKVKVSEYSAQAVQVSSAAGAASNKVRVKNKLNVRRAMRVRATAYSGGGLCANGKRARVGRIAVDPRVVRLGSWVYIEGYGIAQACDTGGAIKGRRVDLYMASSGQCSRYGVRHVKMYVLR